MLNENKKMYESVANYLPGWKKLGRSELCFLYIENENDKPLAESYLSAIICKFWNVAEHNYKNRFSEKITEEDCLNSVIDSILYVLENRVWEDPNNSLYGDKNAPEKAINVKAYYSNMNLTGAANRQKRKSFYESFSLDSLTEDYNDYFMPQHIDKYSVQNDYLNGKIADWFNSKNYVTAFTVDAIINNDVFDLDENRFVDLNLKKLKHSIKYMNDARLEQFAEDYGLSIEKVNTANDIIKNLSYCKINTSINKVLNELKYDKELKKYLRS